MQRSRVGRLGRSSKKSGGSSRRLRWGAFEQLEPRLTLSALPTSVGIGAPMLVAFNDPAAVAGTTFSAHSTNPDLTATVLHTSHLLEMTVHTVNADGSTGISGTMEFALLDDYAPNNITHVSTLANSTASTLTNPPAGANFYDGLTFHRIIQNFMIQGGDPLGTGSGGSGPNGAKGNAVDDEFSADLRFTSSGLLAMANSGSDTNDCQFFVTADTFRSGDYTYTILGKLVAGDDIRQAIANVPVEDNGNGEVSKPLHPPIIDSIRVVTDTHYGLVMLKPGAGAAVDETATVTVTASDNSSVTLTASDGTSQPSLDTTLVADTPSTGDHPAFITPVPDVHTTMNTPVTFAIPVTVGDPGVPLAYASDTSDPYNLQINTSGTGPTDGSATVTPSGNLLGVHGVRVGVRRDSTDPSSNTNYDIQDVAVFIRPTTPTSISVLTSGVQDGSTTSITSGLTFRVTGVTGGLTTAIYIDSNPTPIATAFAFGSTVDVQIGQLSNGPHTFIARQLFSHGAVKVGNRTIAAGDLNSDVSPNAVHITVQAKPTFAMTVPTSGTFNAGQNVGIAWSADSVPLGATVSLCYDDDATWFNGNEHWIEVSQVAAANGYGSYQWNTTGVKPGTYYIAGYLWVDGVPKFSHLLTPITITGPAVPSFAVTAPASGSFAAGQSVTIAWKDQNAPADARISLAYDTDTAINGNEQWIEIDQAAPANGLGTYQWNTTGVKPGTYYIAGYLWSNGAPTFSHLLTPITITGPVAPSFAVTAPASGSFVAGQNVTIAWKDQNAPADARISLAYDTDTAINGNEQYIEIHQVAPANGLGTFQWNTTGVKPGTYYIAGYLWSNGVPTFSHLLMPITITGPAAPSFAVTAPASGSFVAGQNVTIAWKDQNAPADARISLAYDTDTAINGNEQYIEIHQVAPANGYGTYQWNTTGVKPGNYYLAGYLWSNGVPTFSHLLTPITITGAALVVDASVQPIGGAQPLTNAQLQPIVDEAERRLAAATGIQVAAAMTGVSVQITDLPRGMLGEAAEKTIFLSPSAAGYGWFVDPSPRDDVEFTDLLGAHTLAAHNGSAAAARVDLLTTVMHEMGHLLGLKHADAHDDLMYPSLPLGERKL